MKALVMAPSWVSYKSFIHAGNMDAKQYHLLQGMLRLRGLIGTVIQIEDYQLNPNYDYETMMLLWNRHDMGFIDIVYLPAAAAYNWTHTMIYDEKLELWRAK